MSKESLHNKQQKIPSNSENYELQAKMRDALLKTPQDIMNIMHTWNSPIVRELLQEIIAQPTLLSFLPLAKPIGELNKLLSETVTQNQREALGYFLEKPEDYWHDALYGIKGEARHCEYLPFINVYNRNEHNELLIMLLAINDKLVHFLAAEQPYIIEQAQKCYKLLHPSHTKSPSAHDAYQRLNQRADEAMRKDNYIVALKVTNALHVRPKEAGAPVKTNSSMQTHLPPTTTNNKINSKRSIDKRGRFATQRKATMASKQTFFRDPNLGLNTLIAATKSASKLSEQQPTPQANPTKLSSM